MSATGVGPFYRSVIDDVINNLKEVFLDEGVDEQVLTELKQTWETRLAQTKAVPAENVPPVAAPIQQHFNTQQMLAGTAHNQTTQGQHNIQQPSQTVQYQITTISETGEAVPKTITITLPPNLAGGSGIVMSGPASAAMASLQGTGGQTMIPQSQIGGAIRHTQDGRTVQYQAITADQLAKQGYTLNLAPSSSGQPGQVQMQQLIMRRDNQPGYMVNMAQPSTQPGQAQLPSHILQRDPNHPGGYQLNLPPTTQPGQTGGIFQLDGANDNDTSDDEDDDDDEDIDDEDHIDDEVDGAEEDVPLNSEDDVSNEDPSEVFDTDNVIVCQFDKITRSRNRWKFHFKDGIMNLQGKDYVFQRALGDAEW